MTRFDVYRELEKISLPIALEFKGLFRKDIEEVRFLTSSAYIRGFACGCTKITVDLHEEMMKYLFK
ncbi:MAG: hypothetical protein K2G70_07680 [Turicibacter sp.]|nr:hypothetical protein [Turicibacter sp.]